MSIQTDFWKKFVEGHQKLVEGHRMLVEAGNEVLKVVVAQPELGLMQEPMVCQELTFLVLKFDDMDGGVLGDHGVACKGNNLPDKWASAFNVLRVNNATIKNRYQGESFQFSYWLYNDKIYRQKIKQKT